MMRLEVLLNLVESTLSLSFVYKHCDWIEMVYNKREKREREKKIRTNEDYWANMSLSERRRRLPPELYKREMESDGPGNTRNPLFSLILSFSFLFFFFVGRSLLDGWTYVCACMFNKRGDDWRGKERAEYNTTNIRQHRKIDEEEKKQRMREVKVERARERAGK